jgi:hypothetical protein
MHKYFTRRSGLKYNGFWTMDVLPFAFLLLLLFLIVEDECAVGKFHVLEVKNHNSNTPCREAFGPFSCHQTHETFEAPNLEAAVC